MDDISPTISKPTPLPLQLDEFCDIIGGQSWLQFIYNLKTNQQQHRVQAVSKLKLSLTGKRRFLCTGDLVERQILEIYYIKLSLIVHVTQIIKDAHKLLNSPLLNITPGTIRIGLASTQTLSPSLWNYKLAYERHDPEGIDLFVNPNLHHEDQTESPLQDFYCLGMLIARTLLVNRSQSMVEVKSILDEVSKSLTEIYKANRNQIDPEELKSRLMQVLENFLNDKIFKQRNVIYKPEYYARDLINPSLWRGIMCNCFRLITNIPGFSYFSSYETDRDKCWNTAEELFFELTDAEHQAKRNLLSESLNPSKDLYELVSELTSNENWPAAYFDEESSLTKKPSKDNFVEIDIFGLEEDLAPGKMLTGKANDHGRVPDNDSSAVLELLENIADEQL